MLQEIDTVLDEARVTRLVYPMPVAATEVVTIIPASDCGPDPAAGEAPSKEQRIDRHSMHVGKVDVEWSWQDLRDYVVSEIEARFGLFPRDAKREAGTFKAFLARWGPQAPAIARWAFDVEDGYWCGAPISVNRFCKASDTYFGAVIAERLS